VVADLEDRRLKVVFKTHQPLFTGFLQISDEKYPFICMG
tara:strand:- start:403 stop:519 length:117 start_codon:yes stop_codon:yes gene_type:complete